MCVGALHVRECAILTVRRHHTQAQPMGTPFLTSNRRSLSCMQGIKDNTIQRHRAPPLSQPAEMVRGRVTAAMAMAWLGTTGSLPPRRPLLATLFMEPPAAPFCEPPCLRRLPDAPGPGPPRRPVQLLVLLVVAAATLELLLSCAALKN